MSIHGKVLVGRHGAVIHDRCSLAVQIVDGNRRSRRTHGTSHTGHDRCYRSAAVGCHFHGTGTSLAVFLTCRDITVYKFCIGGEVIVDHAHAGPNGTGDHSRRHCCRSADQSGLMVVFGRDVQALVVADDVLHGGGHGAVQFGGGCCCRYCACPVDSAGTGHAVRIGDDCGILVCRYGQVPAVDRLFRRIRAAQFRSRLPVKEHGIRCRAHTGPAIGADAHRQGAHMAFALGHIVGFHGHITGHAVIQLGIDIRAGHGGPGGPADVIHGHCAGGTYGHRVRTGQSGCQGHALQVMLTGRGHSHALLRIAHRLGLLAPGLQGTFFHSAFHIARDGIVADAHAEPCIAGRTAHRSGKVGQIFLPAGQYADVAAAGQGAARHSSLHVVANLVHGDVPRKSYLAGHSCAHTDGRNGGIPVCLHGGMLVFDRAAAHGGRSILIDAVDGYAGAAGKVTAAGTHSSQAVDGALAVRLDRHIGSFVRSLVDGAVLHFRRHSLVDKSRGSCALDGHFAGTADAYSSRGQGGTVHRLNGRGPVFHMGQGGLVQGRPGLLAGFCRAGGSAAHIVIGHGAADGNFTARADASGHSQTVVAARSLYLGALGIGQDRVFGLMTALIIQGLADDCFRIAAAVVDRNGAAESRVFAGCHSCADAVDLAGILGGHFDGRTVRTFGRDTAAGQVGTDVVVQTIVGQGSPNACRLAVGHGAGHVHGLGVAGRFHLEVVRGQIGIRHLGLNPVVLILPGHAAHAAEVLGTGGHTGAHVHRQRVRIGIDRDRISREYSLVDGRREIVVQIGHVHGRAGRIAAGAGHHKGGTHAEAAPVAVIVHGFSCRHRVPIVLIVFVIGILVVGTAVRINAGVFGKLLMIPVVPQEVLIRLGFCRAAGGIVCADRDGIRRHPGAAIDAGLHIIVQAVVDHGSGKGVVCPITTHGDAGRDGRRNLPGGQ